MTVALPIENRVAGQVLSASDRIARNLVRERLRAGLTQQELANAAGISRATVHVIESGNGDPRISTVQLLAGALGVSLDALLIT